MAMLLYNLVFPIAFLVYLPFYLARLVRRGGLDRRFLERFGIFEVDQKQKLRALTKPVWIHAVSVGEVVAATGFIARWRERSPGCRFVLSTTTTTGHALAVSKTPPDIPVIYCPIDCWLTVRRVLKLVAPRQLIIFEVEYWPNLITQVARRGAGVALVNGRMSDRSSAGYARHRWFFGKLFGHFSVFCMQSEGDAERVRNVIGDSVPVHACGTMKFDQVPWAEESDKSALMAEVFGHGERLVWTAGSTHADEEALVADVFLALKTTHPGLKLILVPRHHERTPEVEKILRERGLSYRLLKGSPGETGGRREVDVLLVNTTGELMGFYGVSDIVYVGKSLAGCSGGHNIIEPAIFGKPIVHGAGMQNFRLVVEQFREAGAAIEVSSDEGLLPALEELCDSESRRKELSEKSRKVVLSCRGAMDRTLDLIADSSRKSTQ